MPYGKYPLVKVIIPNYAAGSIIGKGGQNINQIQQTFGARIKLSPNNEYYPGTQERILVIMGELDQIMAMLNYIHEKVRQEPQGLRGAMFDHERAKQVKIVVPNSTAGMIIGKSGSTIRDIGEKSGARIQISQKDAENFAGERVISVSGTQEQNQAASRLIIAKCQEDPDHALNNNISYGINSVTRALANGLPGAQLAGAAGFAHSLASLNNASLQGAANPLLTQAALLGGNPLVGNPLAPGSLGMPGLGPAVGGCISTTSTLEMNIPDQLVGAILGKGGKTVNEFMQYSGARIQITQKGEFVPGTNNRKVTITGDPNATQIAHFLITQRLQQVESERQMTGQTPPLH